MFLWKVTHGSRKSSGSTLLCITSPNRTVFVRVLLLWLIVCFPEVLWGFCLYSVGTTALPVSGEQGFPSASKLVRVAFKESCNADLGL